MKYDTEVYPAINYSIDFQFSRPTLFPAINWYIDALQDMSLLLTLSLPRGSPLTSKIVWR